MKKFLIAIFVAFTLFSTVHAVGVSPFQFKNIFKKFDIHEFHQNTSYMRKVLSAYTDTEKRALLLKYKGETDDIDSLISSIDDSRGFRAVLTLNMLKDKLKEKVRNGTISKAAIKVIEPYRNIMYGKLVYKDNGEKIRDKLKSVFGKNENLLKKLIALLACGSDFKLIYDERSIYPTGACG